ncbi:hypothetical protein P12x_002802 [Tundrisphaera lichenicola]|uniref:hypothetical protein n=1 Tax=Tundrisphaera lichenicola TaxID=2029860 RepID=UPI003EBF9F00
MKHRVKIGLSIALVMGLGMAASGALAQQKTPPTRSEFMRAKLEFSGKVLEGLTVEDYAMIEKGAKALKKLSQAAEWEVPTIPSVPEYLVYTNEFQRLADEIAQKARDKNLDGATLAYVKLTMSCVHCHKYIRGPAH